MKISVITVCYNSAATLAETILSVASQTHPEVEHIVIDGGSTDGTVEIVKQYKDKLAHWLSEKDDGMYAALNKGLRLATGEVIAILNSDDLYANNRVLEKVAAAFAREKVEAVYGDIILIERQNPARQKFYWKAGRLAQWKIRFGWMPPHPGLFVRKEAYARLGGFRPELKIAGDYELMLRFFKINKISAFYLTQPLVKMREGGMGDRFTWRKKQINWQEIRTSWRLNGLRPPLFLISFRILLFRLARIASWVWGSRHFDFSE